MRTESIKENAFLNFSRKVALTQDFYPEVRDSKIGLKIFFNLKEKFGANFCDQNFGI